MEWFLKLGPVTQALIATLGTWAVTALGAGLVVFTRRFSQKYSTRRSAWPPAS